ncbi:MAG: carboxypeptidase regulatory-like domain-containing protein, partial [Planctomycetaceae bacterium]|nr:carboxypeptidase regulatory-like domain-containing protein [Planctomycetaceae bacterium]
MIEVRTDASGKFSIGEIPPGPVIMHAISEDYAPQIQIAEATTGKPAEVNFELSPGKSITGRIVDVEGKPITNVWLITDTWDKYRMFNREARTDADGKFELVHMPDTAAEVHILKQGYINIRDRSFQGGEHVDLVMKPEITLRFVVRDTEAKTTVPNLAIAVGRLWSSNDDYYWSSNEWETTRYYDALAGEMKIEIDETMTYQTAYRFRAPGYEEQIVKIDPELNESQVYQVEMKRAELLSAQVVHSHSGEPAAGVKIVLADPNDRFHPDHYVDFMTPWDYLENRDYSGVVLQTDVNGQFRFSRPKHPQTILVIVSPDGSFQAVPRFMSLLQAQEELKRPLVIPIEKPAQIKGQVLLGGKPVPNVIMKIHWNPQPDHGSSMEQMFGVGGQITTDASGHFEFPPIARGTYTLYRVHMVQSNRYSTSLVFDSKTVSLESGESREVVFDRNGGLTLKGILKGETGEPVAGCVVSLAQSGASQPLEIVEANDKGEFQFDHLLPGEYQLEAKHYSILEYLDVDQSGQLTVQVAEEIQPVQVQLKKINRNQPVPSAEASVFSLTGSLPHELEFTHPETQKPYRLSEQTGKVVVLCATARWSTDLKALQKQLEPWQNHSRMDLLCFHQGTKEEFDTYCQQQSVEWKLPVICSKDNQQSLLLTHFGLMPGLSLIVGPDGLFVGDQFGHAELNSRLTQLQQKMGDSPMEQPDRKKLSITLASNTLSGGILDASLKLSALDQNGKVVETARFGMPVEATRVIWNYSAIGVAEVQAELKVPDQPAMPQKLNAGEEPLEMKFQLDAPRLITGSILTSENQPVPGMEIIVMRIGAGYTRIGNDLKTDESGKFTMPCFPGNYYLAAKSNKQFSVPDSTKSVSVASGANPEPVAYVAYPAISVRLKILKSDGTPADQATVASNVGTEQSKTDENGEVELSGISSEGQTQLWFQKDSEYGSFILQSPDPGKLYTASIGPQGNDNQNPSPIAAKSLRNLEVISVAGEKTTLPTGQSRSVVVIGPLWRLDTQLMISKASSFCEEKRAQLILVATDPDYEQFHTLLEQLKTDHLLSYYLASNPSDENQWHQVILPRTILVDENLVQLEALFTDQDANL